MKKLASLTLLLFFLSNLYSQFPGTTFGLVRENYFSTVTDPFDSTIVYEQFDSAHVRLGKVDVITGYVAPLGTDYWNGAVNLTGAALNPYDSTFLFFGASDLLKFKLGTGEFLNPVSLSNPNGPSYFDLLRFNHSDSTLYGLARRNVFDPVTQSTTGEMFLASVNTQTGVITQISPNSVGQGFAMAGSVIDPHEMVFYYSTGSQLIGLDIYTGGIYRNVPITVPDGFAFDNFAYNCADTNIYGLIRQNYFSWVPDPFFPGDSMQVLDSATLRLGKIDPVTGIVTAISTHTAVQGGYTINGGAAVDPMSQNYYFSTGTNIVGISLVTGEVTSNVAYDFADGEFFDLMRNFQNCFGSAPSRTDSTTSVSPAVRKEIEFSVSPNPAENRINLQCETGQYRLEVISILGETMGIYQIEEAQSSLDLGALSPGMYFLKCTDRDDRVAVVKLVKE